ALGGDFAGAAKLAATLDPMRAVAAKWLHGKARLGGPPPPPKARARPVGMSGGPVRAPLISHTPAEQADLAADLAAVGLLNTDALPVRAGLNGHGLARRYGVCRRSSA